MSEAPAATPAPQGKSLPARVWGILTSPRETFADVVARPRWFGMMALVILVAVVCTGGFLYTDVGKQAWLDQAVRSMESSGTQVSDEAYARVESVAKFAPYLAVGGILIFQPLVTLALAGVLFAVFNAALGGDSSFKQTFAVVVHTGAISVVQQLFVAPLNYVRESMSSATNLAVFLPMLDETSFVAKFLGTVDLFIVWWVFLLAIGLSVLYRRKTGPIATGLFVVYGIIAIIFAAVSSGGSGA
ncbi:MAG: YIP1 family protein [Acidobacteriota bacterium]